MTITVTVKDVELPEAVQRGAQTILDDSVEALTSWSGLEQINRKSTRRPRSFSIGYGIRDQALRQAIGDLYLAHGQTIGFLHKDWYDSTIANQRIDSPGGVSIANGSNKDFYLFKTYSNGALVSPVTYERPITRPDSSSISITINGTPTAAFTVQPLGLIRFTAAPAAAANITVVVATFKTPVRFAGKMPIRVDTAGKIAMPGFQLKELFER